jgi:hypothetical protein
MPLNVGPQHTLDFQGLFQQDNFLEFVQGHLDQDRNGADEFPQGFEGFIQY